MTYGLLTRHSRKTTTLSHPPWHKSPVILKSTLHWMVDKEWYQRANSRSLLCAESIMSFDMDTETIYTMSCPGDKYGKRADNSYVHLLKKEECLCFFDTSSYRGMDFWVLQDYAEEVWTKTHVLNLELILPCCRSELQYIISAPDIDNDELLLVWNL
ncbi:hypothetical protein IFM89_004191 [Coptis chinensis]|uniref:F-box associated beta-propeller type 1 domain-containing protein n=1 Tax=Coptis chinensis TaxID=261450 RepID=A0A835HC85_9MAGN|nr:hypothetical protein IFM89_004191 [Coptis chinensis]